VEEPTRLPSSHRINFSVHLSVCLFVCLLSMKTRRIFTWELKSGCPRGVFCPLSIPPKYLFLCMRRKFGFNKKIRRKSLIVYVYYHTKFLHYLPYTRRALMGWRNFLKTAEKKFLQPTRSGCGYPAHTGLIFLSVHPSVCLSVWNMKTCRF
jgi:hypothetical protein